MQNIYAKRIPDRQNEQTQEFSAKFRLKLYTDVVNVQKNGLYRRGWNPVFRNEKITAQD